MTHETNLTDNQETLGRNEPEACVPEQTPQVSTIPLECYKYVGGGSAIFQFG
jgi:hypothetical protein